MLSFGCLNMLEICTVEKFKHRPITFISVEHCKQALSPAKWFRCDTRNFLLALTANYVRYFYNRPSELLLHLIRICNGDQLPGFS